MLLDTNVLLDAALGRRPHVDAAVELLNLIALGTGRAFVAWHAIATLYYVASRSHGDDDTRSFIMELMRFVSVAPTSTEAVRYAASLPMADFEDAMQVAAARACGAEYIVTRNLSDFERSPIPALTPQEALARLR